MLYLLPILIATDLAVQYVTKAKYHQHRVSIREIYQRVYNQDHVTIADRLPIIASFPAKPTRKEERVKAMLGG